MSISNKNKGLLKPLSLTFMSCLLALTLSSCSKAQDKYDDINGNEAYVTLGNRTVTNKELFDQMKWSSASYLGEKLNTSIVSHKITEVTKEIEENNNPEYINEVQKLLVCDVYGFSSIDDYDGFNNPYLFSSSELKYKDNAWKNHRISIDSKDIARLISRVSYTDPKTGKEYEAKSENGRAAYKFSDLSNVQKELFRTYYESYAQKLYAYQVLEKEIADHNDELEEGEDRYFSNSEIIAKWKEDYLYSSTVNAILIRFINEDEVNAVFKAFGVKAYRSELYFIPQKDRTDAQYSKYYDDYDFANNLSSVSYDAVKLTSNTNLVFALYIEMYNYIYSYRESLQSLATETSNTTNRRNITQDLYRIYSTLSDEEASKYTYQYALEHGLKDNENTTFTKKALDEINSSLTTYLYDTLKITENSGSATTNYSIAGQNYGDFYYMAYKLNTPESDKKLYYTNSNEDELYYVEKVENEYKVYTYDGNSKLEISDEKLKELAENDESLNGLLSTEGKKAYYELLEEIYENLKQDTLTSSYISNCITNAKENVEARIYDEDIEIAYEASNSDYKGNKKKSDYNVIATFKYEDEDLGIENETVTVTISDVWEELEISSGISSAVSLLSTELIKETDAYKKITGDKDKIDTYYQNLNNLLSNFANDQLSSSGYSSSLGKYKFLKLYFHSTDMEEIVHNFYCVNEASATLLNDYSSEKLALFLQEYANNYYDSYFSVSATNLLVYVDMNEDGNPDKAGTEIDGIDIFDWSRPVPGAEYNCTYGELAQELIKKVIKLVDNSTDSNVDALSKIVSEYNSASRFDNDYNHTPAEDGDYNPTAAEREWAKYRKAGLYIKTSELASVSNSTDYASCYDVLKLAIYKAYTEEFLFNDEVMPNEYMITKYYEGTENGLVTNEGYNLLVLTSATEKASAKYDPEDYPESDIYKDLVYIYGDDAYKIADVYSLIDENGDYSDKLSLNQVLAFMLEYAANGSTSSLPASVTTALTTYLQPVFTRFTSSESQFEVLIQFLVDTLISSGEIQNKNQDAYLYFVFGNSKNSSTEVFAKLLETNHNSADSYLVTENVYSSSTSLTFFDDEENVKLYFSLQNQYDNWWTNLNALVKTMKEGK